MRPAAFPRGVAQRTIPPARVLVMGAGVAGLQAIATARRLGGVVSATDVRLAAKEQQRWTIAREVPRQPGHLGATACERHGAR